MPAKYGTKSEYLKAISDLHQRARRSGWNIQSASRTQIASWLDITADRMTAINRAYNVELDDIRAGWV